MLSAAEIAAGVRAGELDPVEVIEEHLAAIEGARDLNAVITDCADQALSRARERPDGPLAGVPLLVKDLFDTAGIRTTYGSSIWRDHVPRHTAAAVAQLEAAGAITVAKTNLHEFAWGTTSQNPHFGFVENPARPGRVAGGSSGGNSAGLAAGLGALALGTDTGGSIRIPSACCDTAGFKPTFGKVAVEGCLPLAPSFDTVGPMARTVADCALAYSVLSGEPVPEPGVEGLTVGVLARAAGTPGVEHAGGEPLAVAARRLDDLGARVVEAELPEPDGDLFPLFFFECTVSHYATFPARQEEYGPDTRMKWSQALEVSPAAAWEARRARARWQERCRTEPAVDLILSPTLAIEVPPIDVWEPDVRGALTAYTRPFNFLLWPALAIGDLQLAGRDDSTVLAAGLAWEEAYGPAGLSA